MTESLDIRRKRLRFRAWHRGTREADLILGPFADRHLAGFDAATLERFEALLEETDADLYAWISGQMPPPERVRGPLWSLLSAFKP
ncbi:MAG: succinate dehydrogenase assembly factor 2 [Alphaproteobacteria bacterium]|nr:succinate dehydrogenase assembly factor 2 [Alphaproteobacteria bacterium]